MVARPPSMANSGRSHHPPTIKASARNTPPFLVFPVIVTQPNAYRLK